MGDFNRRSDRRRPSRGGFDRRRIGSFGRGDRGRDGGRDRHSERPEMHSVVCDECSKDCEVPFRPTQGKPIYCDDCFRGKKGESGSRSGKPIDNEKLDQVNKKLDKILKILESAKEPVEEKPEVKKLKSIEKEPEVKKDKKKKAKKKK